MRSRRESRRRRSAAPAAPQSTLRSWAPYVLTALAIWLGWQILMALLVQRGPAETAVRMVPGSAQALSRAAEDELIAGRTDQAEDLAVLALRAAPFDLRALRVLGLVRARTDENAADPILTLAGNWSLRDDPSHAWLMTRRLRQGDYAGAFGHADTLARRREDLRPAVFRFFTTAASLDPRAVPVLIDRFGVMPNWRSDYFESLRAIPEGPAIQAALAVGLNDGPGRLNDAELQTIYLTWAEAGRIPGLRTLRARVRRPAPAALHDGEFDDPAAPIPFRWLVGTGPGLSAALSEDPSREDQRALYVETDGFAVNTAATQLLLLDPGPYAFSGAYRFEVGGHDPQMRWTLACLETGEALFSWSPEATDGDAGWRSTAQAFVVPASGCTAQWLSLTTTRGERRSTVAVWFDHFRLVPGADNMQEK